MRRKCYDCEKEMIKLKILYQSRKNEKEACYGCNTFSDKYIKKSVTRISSSRVIGRPKKTKGEVK